MTPRKGKRKTGDQNKSESAAMVRNQWKTTRMLLDNACTDYIVANIDALLDVAPILSVVRNPNGEAGKVVDCGCV